MGKHGETFEMFLGTDLLITLPNFVVKGNQAAAWNSVGSRRDGDDGTLGWRYDYEPYPYAQMTLKVRDFFGCAVMFLSLGLAAVTFDGSQDLDDASHDFRIVAKAMMVSLKWGRPRPPMPPRLLDSKWLGEQGRTVVDAYIRHG